MTMLDFPEGRTYAITPDTKVLIRPSDVEVALKDAISEKTPARTETQQFIIDRYDRLFFVVSQLQVAVRSGLVRKDDVKFPLSWYVEKRLCKRKQLILDYMKENAAPETMDFVTSLDAWTRCSSGEYVSEQIIVRPSQRQVRRHRFRRPLHNGCTPGATQHKSHRFDLRSGLAI